MTYDFQDILRQAMAGGLGQQDWTGQRTTDSWTDPATGLTVIREGAGGYRFVQPGEGGSNTAWDMGANGQMGAGSRDYKTAGLGSQLGEFGREGALPLALSALGANAIGAGLGQASAFDPGGILNFSGASQGGLPEVSFGQWQPTPEYGAHFVGADTAGSMAGDATRAALYGDAGYGAGMSGAATGAYDAGVAAGALGGGSGLLGDLLSGAGGGLAKYALPALGALAGATQGKQGTSSTTTRSADPRLTDAVYGSNGAGGLLSDATTQYRDNIAKLNHPAIWSGLLDQYNAGLRALTTPGFKWGK